MLADGDGVGLGAGAGAGAGAGVGDGDVDVCCEAVEFALPTPVQPIKTAIAGMNRIFPKSPPKFSESSRTRLVDFCDPRKVRHHPRGPIARSTRAAGSGRLGQGLL
jgi:hypothetical protein